MVGVPRSKGCLLCVKRRVKCDEVKPACGNCARYGNGTACPGYERDHKFVANKHQMKPRRGVLKDTPSCTSALIVTSEGSSSSTPSSSPAAHSQDGVTSIQPATAQAPVLYNAPIACRGPCVNSLLNTMMTRLEPNEISYMYPWITGTLQAHVGTKATLDSAVMSLVLHMLGKRFDDRQLICQSRDLYGQSLNALQAALNSRSEWKTTETLCTTTLLCHFEMFAGTGTAVSWMKHAAAVGWLIQSRGPSAFADSWDRSILNSFRTAIIMNCFWTGKDCFLAKPQWQQVLIDTADSKYPPTQRLQTLINDYFRVFAKLPGIMGRIHPLYKAHLRGSPTPVQTPRLTSLGDYIHRVYRDLMSLEDALHCNMPPPVDIPTAEETSLWPTVFKYENVWHGSMYIGYWTNRLILQIGIELTKGRDETFEDNSVLVANILRSCETLGEGIMGPYRIGFGLRCAYDAADAPTRAWIKARLERYKPTYASLDASVFNAPDEV